MKDNFDLSKQSYYNKGTIETRVYIDDVLTHNGNLSAKDGLYLGTILKYLSTRLGNKTLWGKSIRASLLEDLKKSYDYLGRWIKIVESELEGEKK